MTFVTGIQQLWVVTVEVCDILKGGVNGQAEMTAALWPVPWLQVNMWVRILTSRCIIVCSCVFTISFPFPASPRRSTVLSKSRGKVIEDPEQHDPLFTSADLPVGAHTSTCGHVMHADCWQRSVPHPIMTKEGHSILVDGSHVLYLMFETMLSGRRFRCSACKTYREKPSFIPVAISLFKDAKWMYFMCTHARMHACTHTYTHIHVCIFYHIFTHVIHNVFYWILAQSGDMSVLTCH